MSFRSNFLGGAIVVLLVLGVATAILQVWGIQGAQGVNSDQGYYARPTLWAPAFIEAQMRYESWGNVAYFFNWDLNESASVLVGVGSFVQ